MSDELMGFEPEQPIGKEKYAVYRVTRDVFMRLYEKRQRGERINFKERGGDHRFTIAERRPTAEEIKSLSGTGYHIIEQLYGGTPFDWFFESIEPEVNVFHAEHATQQARPSDTDARLARIERALMGRAGERPRNRARRIARALRYQTPAPPPVNPLDVARMVTETVERSAEQERKRQAELRAEMREEIAARMPKDNSTKAPAPDPTESFLSTYEKFVNISERINPNGEARSGWLDKITGVVESVARVASTPAVGAVVMRLMTAPPSTAGTQAAPHAATASAPPQPHIASVTEAQAPPTLVEAPQEEETAESAVSVVMSDACHDLLNNVDISESAKDITRMLEDWPELVEHIEPLLALPTPQMQNALALLAGELGPQILAAPHAIEWLDKLKTAIALRRGPVLVAPSKNGNGVQAA